MAELIDRDALKAHYAWWGDTEERKAFDDIVDAQPTVEAVPVIRCKDCKWWTPWECNDKYGECERIGERDQEGGAQIDCTTDFNDFCSYGERKEQG